MCLVYPVKRSTLTFISDLKWPFAFTSCVLVFSHDVTAACDTQPLTSHIPKDVLSQLISYSSRQFAIDQFPWASMFTNGAFPHLAFGGFVECTIEVCVWGRGWVKGWRKTVGARLLKKTFLLHNHVSNWKLPFLFDLMLIQSWSPKQNYIFVLGIFTRLFEKLLKII